MTAYEKPPLVESHFINHKVSKKNQRICEIDEDPDGIIGRILYQILAPVQLVFNFHFNIISDL